MSFTDRFINLPIQVFDREEQELTGKAEAEDSYMMVNPLEISNYRPSYDKDDLKEKEIVSMTLKNGNTTLIYLSVKAFESLLNNHTREKV